jgi:hypothetical protein
MLFAQQVIFMALLQRYVSSDPIGAINMITGLRVFQPWLETGYSLVEEHVWTTARSSFTNFSSDFVIFTSLPDIGGSLYTESNATAARIRNIVSDSSGISFQIRVCKTIP